ncbi:hypothetical protein INT48_003719 [Thamnidium elegans]|uniref:Uncharacterized protein n=1 Tax=Thamnidium elegans TaxID=101142 RepID=A0A8H7SM87_9FUNG|nr:hypothetical protein INT48_003719 [Thamnidium elegans]
MQAQSELWEQRLIGKTLVQDNAETVLDEQKTFKISELPPGHRILPPGAPQTRDFRPDRLNVFVTEDYVVEKAYFS